MPSGLLGMLVAQCLNPAHTSSMPSRTADHAGACGLRLRRFNDGHRCCWDHCRTLKIPAQGAKLRLDLGDFQGTLGRNGWRLQLRAGAADEVKPACGQVRVLRAFAGEEHGVLLNQLIEPVLIFACQTGPLVLTV